jgi:membrane protease subunit HflK
MPWSNQGGGPWGSGGGKGPWGSGPQPSGPTPPDLEEFLRRSQDKLRTVLPGGSLSGKGLGLIVLAAVAIWASPGSSVSIPTSSAWCCASANSCARCSPD